MRKIIELSPAVRPQVAFLMDIQKRIPFGHQRLLAEIQKHPEFNAYEPEKREKIITDCLEKAYADDPAATMITMIMVGKVFNHMSGAILGGAGRTMNVLIWGLIFGDLFKIHGITKKVWENLQLSLIDNPVAQGVIVTGHQFSAEELGVKAISQDTSVPDFIPTDMMHLADDDEDDDG